MKKIAIIPARGGSKRIPRKNIKPFLGKPIIAYSIEAAVHSGLFDEVMVSTDDKEIAEISKCFGASVPFFRSTASSNDFATTADVLTEVLEQYKNKGNTYDYGCCLYPTAPLINQQTLHKAQDLLLQKQYNCVFPVVKFSYPIWRSLKLENGKAEMNWPEHLNTRSQDLPPAYHDAGQFYWFHVDTFLQNKTIIGSNAGAVELDETEVQDIDNLTDWKLAELKYQLSHERQKDQDE
ncbi:pseudaminic acid cytidylyltransferase [Pontibacter silvestris]|uniref:Pseudaminic acid cytidylyltransferase n=1 Tax=Pontibacter silvestris TaxID=2305183 RepID=A0ABW4WVA7_9BACT|nr:pseudaminic acid cytidylyltransferase [Pontibacter silvestris]MCC9137757.1 pseudaminic acid cytidylyltransferase [Pontibacter silvestris]